MFTAITGLSKSLDPSTRASAIPSGSADAVGHTITINPSTSSDSRMISRESLYLDTGASPITSTGFLALPSAGMASFNLAVVSSSN